MSTRASIWYGEDRGVRVHFYWELAEREIKNGEMTGAPVYVSVERRNSGDDAPVRLPVDVAEALLSVLAPENRTKVL